jgi:hypothetical protein
MLISLFLGLPIVSVAIFGTGLWLGRQWDRSSLVSPMQPDVFSARRTVVAALQQHAPASSLKTTPPRHPDPASRDAEETTKPAPKPPFEDMARSPGLPNDLWSAQFESDAEGWQVVKDSQTPEDIADFIATFPTSRFVGAARATATSTAGAIIPCILRRSTSTRSPVYRRYSAGAISRLRLSHTPASSLCPSWLASGGL